MKTIGILGGMAAASTAVYYRLLNDGVRARLGGNHSADLLIRSLDFAEIQALQAAGDWGRAGQRLNEEAKRLEAGGAQLLLLATNTMHRVADKMMNGVGVPFLHIGDATAQAIQARGGVRPGLLGTAYTMEHDGFYADRLRAAGLNPVIPGTKERELVHRVIYGELVQGTVTEESRARFSAIAGELVAEGADGVILGCTEIGLLLGDENVSAPVFDTTQIHCSMALDLAIGPGPKHPI